ncbi:sensor histidine kinase [Mumia quercus]|uniref:sensor histidine kinase n=1 Tax=Mumia quercus TaxID=2976125 RepID=UPI0021CF46F4|nr:HAMP domain-containing sensor histidine kinase [Mumia quercus]
MTARPRPWRSWTVRSRMTAVVVVAAGAAMVVVTLLGTALLRGYLTDRVDAQVERVTGGQVVVQQRFSASAPSADPMPSLRMTVDDIVGETLRLVHVRSDGHGTPLVGGAGEGGPRLPSAHALADRVGDDTFTVDDVEGGAPWRMSISALPSGEYLAVAASLSDVEATVTRLLWTGLAVSIAAVVLIAGVALAVVRVGLRPLTRMETTAVAIAGGALEARVPDTDPHTEPGRLGLALNTMLGRLHGALTARETSEKRLRAFVADASHELRTPLTSIRGFAELYRRGGAPPGPELDAAMRRIEDEAARMGSLVDDMLVLAALDERRPAARERVDLVTVAADVVRDARARCPGRRIGLEMDVDGGEPVLVAGDEARLRQVATNLVANALEHTAPAAVVTVRTGRGPGGAGQGAGTCQAAVGTRPEGPTVFLEVRDDGAGVAAEHATRIFDRLYRPDRSRVRGAGGGAGLGLSIVAAIATAHGGAVALLRTAPHGATFRVVLPRHQDSEETLRSS